jgi:hypothetical protein
MVKALCYKPEGRGFDIRLGDFLIYLILPAALGLRFTQSLTEMNTVSIKIIMILGSKVRRVRRAGNLTIICERIG